MIKVIHKKNKDKYDNVVYIGRGSALGNPYTSIQGRETLAKFVVKCREESISKFREYLEECIKNKDKAVCNALNEIYKLAQSGDIHLSCYCSPRSCHGDIIKQVVESKIPEEESLGNNQLDLFE